MKTQPIQPTKAPARRHRDRAQIVRRLEALVLAVAALVVMVELAPQDTVTTGDISKVMLADTLNQARTEGAPQQTVVNGWTARDLLELTAKQGAEARDHRPAALLALLVLGLCLALATTPSPRRVEPASPEGGTGPPPAYASTTSSPTTPEPTTTQETP